MKCLVLFVVLVLGVVLAEDTPIEKGKVIVLNDANYDQLTSTGVWLVKYYAPWCGHCKKLAPEWIKLAETVDGVFNVAEVDCTVSTAVAQKMGIRGYPTIKLLEPGQPAVDVRTERKVTSFIDFVVANVKTADLKGKITKLPAEEPTVQQVKPEEKAKQQQAAEQKKPEEEDEPKPADSQVIILSGDNFDIEAAKGPMLVKFYAPWCGHCKRLAPTWEELAFGQKGKPNFRVAKVNAVKERSLAQKFGIRGFPTVFFVAPGLDKPTEYSGERTVGGFSAFAEAEIAKLPPQKAHSEL